MARIRNFSLGSLPGIAKALALAGLLWIAGLVQPVALVQPAMANEETGDDSRSFGDLLDPDTEVPVAHDSAPVLVPEASEPLAEVVPTLERAGAPAVPSLDIKSHELQVSGEAKPGKTFAMLNDVVLPGEMRTLDWSPQNIFEGIPVPTPVLVANGKQRGPVLCMTGAIHGDEINSIETIRRVMYGLDPQHLAGTVVGVPIVNQMGFRRSSRYLPDRRDLNRYFPGTIDGSSASRIAHSLFNSVIRHCDALIDLHTGSFYRTNIPQLRADLTQASVRALVEQFGDIVVLHSEGSPGMLRREATLANVPTVTLEAGEALRIQQGVIKAGVKHINALLGNMHMIKRGFAWGNPQPAYMASRWLRASTGGIFISHRKAGDRIAVGDKLGTITDPITNNESVVVAKFAGKIIGMAMNQVVLPGYAIYHVGIDASRVGQQTAKVIKEIVVEESHEADAVEPVGLNGIDADGVDEQAEITELPVPPLPADHRSAADIAKAIELVLQAAASGMNNEEESEAE